MSTTVRNSKIGFNDIEKIAQQIRSLKKQFNEIENKKSEYQQFHKKKMIELQDVYNNINLYKKKRNYGNSTCITLKAFELMKEKLNINDYNVIILDCEGNN